MIVKYVNSHQSVKNSVTRSEMWMNKWKILQFIHWLEKSVWNMNGLQDQQLIHSASEFKKMREWMNDLSFIHSRWSIHLFNGEFNLEARNNTHSPMLQKRPLHSRVWIAWRSAMLSWKSNTWKFCWIRLRVTDFGITINPRSMAYLCSKHIIAHRSFLCYGKLTMLGMKLLLVKNLTWSKPRNTVGATGHILIFIFYI